MTTRTPRAAQRNNLLAKRLAFTTAVEHAAAFSKSQAALSAQLCSLLLQIEPECLGLYWATQGEFDVVTTCLHDPSLAALPWALPFAQKTPPQMHYRRWDKSPITGTDECGIPVSPGPLCVPDVLLVPCVGYTRSGYRLGYGGGYFDRYVAAHPGITTVGVAWSLSEVSEDDFAPEAHDQQLTLVVTPQGVYN